MSFAAKFAGYCHSADCNYGDNRISEGDDCAYVENEIMHKSCASRERVKSNTIVCKSCWQEHLPGRCIYDE